MSTRKDTYKGHVMHVSPSATHLCTTTSLRDHVRTTYRGTTTRAMRTIIHRFSGFVGHLRLLRRGSQPRSFFLTCTYHIYLQGRGNQFRRRTLITSIFHMTFTTNRRLTTLFRASLGVFRRLFLLTLVGLHPRLNEQVYQITRFSTFGDYLRLDSGLVGSAFLRRCTKANTTSLSLVRRSTYHRAFRYLFRVAIIGGRINQFTTRFRDSEGRFICDYLVCTTTSFDETYRYRLIRVEVIGGPLAKFKTNANGRIRRTYQRRVNGRPSGFRREREHVKEQLSGSHVTYHRHQDGFPTDRGG